MNEETTESHVSTSSITGKDGHLSDSSRAVILDCENEVGQLRWNLRKFIHSETLSPLFTFLREQVPPHELWYLEHGCRYTGGGRPVITNKSTESFVPDHDSEGILFYDHGISVAGYFGPSSHDNPISKRIFKIYHFDVQERTDGPSTGNKWGVECNRLGTIQCLGTPKQILPLKSKIKLQLDSGESMTGHLRHGILVGDIQVSYPSGNLYKGRLGNGAMPHGSGVMWYKKEGLVYSGDFVKSCREGYGELCRVSTSYSKLSPKNQDLNVIYKGFWRLDSYHGHGLYRSPEGHLYEGNFINGARQGIGSQWFNFQSNQEGTASWDAFYYGEWSRTHFLDKEGRGIKTVGRRHGKGVMHSQRSGDMYHGRWFNGKKHDLSGTAIIYVPNATKPNKGGDEIYLGYTVRYSHGDLISKVAIAGYTLDPMAEPVFSDDMASAESYDIYSIQSSSNSTDGGKI